MIKLKRLFCIGFLVLVGTNLLAQETIKGKVFDLNTGEPIVGASVMNLSTKAGVSTDANGAFQLESVSKFQVSAIGYQTKTVAVVESNSYFSIGLKIAYFNLADVGSFIPKSSI